MTRVYIIFSAILLYGATVFAQPDFSADTLEGCDQLWVNFSIDTNTVDIDTISSVQWHFGNETSSNDITPDSVQYIVADSTRHFDVELILDNDTLNSIIKNDYIVVHKSYNAQFQVQELNELSASFAALPQKWTDPLANYTFQWTTDGTSTDNANDTYVHTFDDTGSYNVSLTVEDDYGCISQYDTTIVLNNSYDFPNILNTSFNDYILYEYSNRHQGL